MAAFEAEHMTATQKKVHRKLKEKEERVAAKKGVLGLTGDISNLANEISEMNSTMRQKQQLLLEKRQREDQEEAQLLTNIKVHYYYYLHFKPHVLFCANGDFNIVFVLGCTSCQQNFLKF